jgi:hypothetical protein
VTADDVEWTLGILLAAGHDPDHLLDRYSFDQLSLFARCTLGHHTRMLNMLLAPVLGGQGAEWTGHKVQAPKTNAASRTDKQKKTRDSMLLHQLASSPFGVRTVQGSDAPAYG